MLMTPAQRCHALRGRAASGSWCPLLCPCSFSCSLLLYDCLLALPCTYVSVLYSRRYKCHHRSDQQGNRCTWFKPYSDRCSPEAACCASWSSRSARHGCPSSRKRGSGGGGIFSLSVSLQASWQAVGQHHRAAVQPAVGEGGIQGRLRSGGAQGDVGGIPLRKALQGGLVSNDSW